jgi:hypothetical protein
MLIHGASFTQKAILLAGSFFCWQCMAVAIGQTKEVF